MQIVADRLGFPMLWVDEIQAYVHWLPVTKVQLEHFLCDQPDPYFDESWYSTLLEQNGRLSAAQLGPDNYWRAFATGLRPSEAQRFARWYGERYRIPTLEEWRVAYEALKVQAPRSGAWTDVANLSPRAVALLSAIENAVGVASRTASIEPRLVDTLCLRLGVLEWVQLPAGGAFGGKKWGGLGRPPRKFHGGLHSPDSGPPALPIDPEKRPLPYFGVRLLSAAQ